MGHGKALGMTPSVRVQSENKKGHLWWLRKVEWSDVLPWVLGEGSPYRGREQEWRIVVLENCPFHKLCQCLTHVIGRNCTVFAKPESKDLLNPRPELSVH